VNGLNEDGEATSYRYNVPIRMESSLKWETDDNTTVWGESVFRECIPDTEDCSVLVQKYRLHIFDRPDWSDEEEVDLFGITHLSLATGVRMAEYTHTSLQAVVVNAYRVRTGEVRAEYCDDDNSKVNPGVVVVECFRLISDPTNVIGDYRIEKNSRRKTRLIFLNFNAATVWMEKRLSKNGYMSIQSVNKVNRDILLYAAAKQGLLRGSWNNLKVRIRSGRTVRQIARQVQEDWNH